jgi:hypothetical protein
MVTWAPVGFNPFQQADDNGPVAPGVQPAPPPAAPDDTQAAPPDPMRTQLASSGAGPITTWLGDKFQKIKKAYTGEDVTQYPDAQEFNAAYGNTPQMTAPLTPQEQQDAVKATWLPENSAPGTRARANQAMKQSLATPDQEAQVDILAKAIPGLERKEDQYGNIMLKAPGMSDFAYLNKPGMSKRDVMEFGAQTALTAPLLAGAGASNLAKRVVGGGIGMGLSSLAEDAAANYGGSDQGYDGDRAALSAGLGAAIPAAGAAVSGAGGFLSGAARKIGDAAQAITDPEAVAKRAVQSAFQEDLESGALGNANRAAQLSDRPAAGLRGQDLRTMDFGGESVGREARKAANYSPAAKDDLMRVIGDRFQGQSARGVGVIEGEMGLARSSQQARADLAEQARNARSPLYNASFQEGKDGIESPLLDQLEKSPAFQKAMGRAEITIKDQAATPGWKTTGMKGPNGYTLEYYDQVKRALDDYAGAAFRSGKNSRGAQLASMAKSLRDELDRLVPSYGDARGTALQFFKAGDALEAGQNFANGTYNMADATSHINTLNPAEKKLFAEGFADQYVRRIRSVPDRSNLLNRIMQSPQERDRVKLALGQGRYDQLDSFLRLEGVMDKMRGYMGNSTTAQQIGDMLKGYGVQIGGGGISAYGFNNGDPTAAITGALIAGGRAAQLRLNQRVAAHVGKMLTSKDPEVFLQGLQQIGKSPFSEAIRAFDGLIHGVGAAGGAGLQTGINQQYYGRSGGQ